jgi:hypothetical protein
MKTLFFIAALLGSVYLILQTPAGKSWMEESEPELETQQEAQNDAQQKAQQKIQKVETVSTQVIQSLENKVSELAQNFGQKQQAQIDQLENRIAELENELIMGRIAQKQPQSASDGVVMLHPYNQAEKALKTYTTEQSNSVNTPTAALAATSNNQLQRKRQAKLQDIADKMEMSSLQALVN